MDAPEQRQDLPAPAEHEATVVLPSLAGGRPQPPFKFSRYRPKHILGRGGMGVVWLATDLVLERDVALKVLSDEMQADPAALHHLKEETRKGMQLSHTNILRIYDFVEEGGAAAIAMEYVDGSTLADLRMRRPQLVFTTAELEPWLRQICAALEYAHREQRIAHRDIKPANILITSDGQAKLADFGIARQIVDATIPGAAPSAITSGTLAYMSPQQFLGGRPRPADDIYSLGATLYDLLSGQPPFFRGDIPTQLATVVPPTVAERRAELGITDVAMVPAVWEAMIAACLKKEPAERPQDVREIIRRLDQGHTPGPRRAMRRTRLLTAAGLAALLAAAAFFIKQRPQEDQPVAPIVASPVATPAAPATTTVGWKIIKHDGRDHVTAKGIKDFYQFTRYSLDQGDLTLSNKSMVMKASVDSPELYINNIKFILSYPVIIQEGDALFSRIDLAKLLDPVIRPQAMANPKPFNTVVIDPAYGGHEVGSIGSYGAEKDLTLALAQKLREAVRQRGLQARLTRESDTFLSSTGRVSIANATADSVFISLQFGTAADPAIAGVETYALDPASSGHPYTTGNSNDSANIALATAVHANTVFRLKADDRGIQRARAAQLAGCRQPGIIFVGGYLTHPAEQARLVAPDHQTRLAEAIADSLLHYRKAVVLRREPPPSTSPAAK